MRRPSDAKTFRGRAEAEPPRKATRTPAKPDGLGAPGAGEVVRAIGSAMIAESGLDRLHQTFVADPTRTIDVLKRPHHRASLSSDLRRVGAHVTSRQALRGTVYLAGLTGIAAQNLLSAGSLKRGQTLLLGTPIGWLHLHGDLTARQLSAGFGYSRLRARYDRMMNLPRRSARTPGLEAAASGRRTSTIGATTRSPA